MRSSFALLLAGVVPLLAQPSLDVLTFNPIASGLTQPVAITHAPGEPGRLYITEQVGRVRIWEDGEVLPVPFLDVRSRVSCCDERGLLSIAFHPDFAQNRRFFVYYTDLAGDTAVASGVAADGLHANANSLRTILSIEQPFPNHNGGQLQFGPDGYLYIGTGDGGSARDPNNAGQSLLTLLGKILRIDVDSGDPYAIPADNPFVSTDGAQPEIWHYGLRNPWRWSFDRETGDMLIGDVGQGAREEVDWAAMGVGGLNFGWRRMEGTLCSDTAQGCNDSSFVLPVLEYPHVPGNCGGSIIGGYRYRGFAMPEFRGTYFYGDYCTGRLYAGVEAGGAWSGSQPRQTSSSFSAFGEDDNGELYFADYAGTVYRILSPSVLQPAITSGGVVNAASFAAGQAVAPGSLISVFGEEFAAEAMSAEGTPLPARLSGVELHADGAAIPLIFAGPEQINAQLPWELSGNMASLTARTATTTSTPEAVMLSPYAPGIFTVSGGPNGQAAALIAGTRLLAAPVAESPAARPARRGETISLFATGLGAVSDAPGTGEAAAAAPLAVAQGQVSVTVGNAPAQVTFAGLAPGFVGLYQINATLLFGTPSGDAVEIVLGVESARSNVARIAVDP